MTYAGTMGPVCSAINATVPCENKAWEIGGHALYARAQGAGVKGSQYNGTFSSTPPFNFNTQVPSAWGWGFQLETTYHYSTGKDINVNWWRLHSKTNRTYINQLVLTYTEYDNTSNLDALHPGTMWSNSPEWDQVNIEFAQHLDFGEHAFTRLFGGLNFSRVAMNSEANIKYGYNLNTLYNEVSNSFSAVLNGFGPRFGLDLNYEWDNGLKIYGTGAFSALAGTTKYQRKYVNGPHQPTPAYAINFSSSDYLVVTEIDAKLGGSYSHSLSNGNLTLDLGWLFASYNGALRGSKGDVYGGLDETNRYSDFSAQGLYFGLKWMGQLA